MQNYKTISYKYNSRTKRYLIHTTVTQAIIKTVINLLKSRGKLLFIKQKKDSFEIYEFFLLELEYILDTIINNTEMDITLIKHISGIRDVIDFIREKTWVTHRYNKHIPDLDISSILSKLKFPPMKHQLTLFDKYETIKEVADLRGLMFDSSAGTGKALKNGTPIKTPTGWCNIEDLKIGDYVIGLNGLPTKVIGVYPQGIRNLVRLTFQDGRERDCDLDHLWSVKINNKRYNTIKTSKILKHIDKNISVKIPLYNPELKLKKTSKFKIHPYILGVLLNNTGLKIDTYISSNDTFIINKIIKLLPKGYTLVKEHYGYKIYTTNINNIYIDELKRLNLYKRYTTDKTIPSEYLDASVSDRLHVLQGLLDSGGTIDRYNTLIYKTDGYSLSISLQKLVWSLGDICKIDTKDIVYNTCSLRITSIHKDYNVVIRSGNPVNYVTKPTLKKVLNKSKYEKINNLNIKNYTHITSDEATCIAVESKDKLFVTKDYIVTHNTYMSLAMTEALHYDKTIIIVPKATIERVWILSLKEELYKNEQSVCLLGNGDKEYNGERFILTHYEYIPKLLANTKILRQLRMYKPNVIIDEFHNFNEVSTDRTENLLKLVNTVNFKDIFLLTGTPIKMTLKELVPMLYILDKKFPKVKDVFINFYKNLNYDIFKNLIQYRFDNYRKRIEKEDGLLPPIKIEEYRSTLKNGNDYLLENINDRVKEYKKIRLKYIMDNLPLYQNTYNNLLTEAKNNLLSKHKDYTESSVNKLFKEYESKIKIIHKAANNNTLQDIPDIILYVKDFDNDIILPNINDRKSFRDVRTIIKYPKYKVLGEALGKIILGSRISCYKDLANNIDYKNIMNITDRKVMMFSNYISVLKIASDKCTNLGYNTLNVYGEHIPNLGNIVKQFMDKDSGINPLLATYKSLSTGVPITIANVMLCFDIPFRSYLFDQAVSRLHRIGQTKNVLVLLSKLDTGNKPNITERDLFILNTSEYNVEIITGNKTPYDIPVQEFVIEDEDDEITMVEVEDEIKDIALGFISSDSGILLKDFVSKIKMIWK